MEVVWLWLDGAMHVVPPARFTSFLRARRRMASLALRNRFTKRTALGDGPVVSLTSFGVRIATVHLAIESIAAGRLRPARLVLWLDDADAVQHPTPGLVRLAARGVEIRVCEDDGPHKKYLPYAQSAAHHPRPLVTADDDVLYPPEWLLGLARAHDRHPGEVLAYRVDRIAVRHGRVLPYAEWSRAADTTPSPRNVAVGVKGILYPAEFVDELRETGTAFRALAPGSSDVWLHHVALRHRRPVRAVLGLPIDAIVPMRGGRARRGPSLEHENIAGGRNDRVVAAVLRPDEVAAIVDDDLGRIEPGVPA